VERQSPETIRLVRISARETGALFQEARQDKARVIARKNCQ
jgi:hypothetical protein